MRAVNREAETTAHGNAVNQRDKRLREGVDPVVDQIFGAEEGAPQRHTLRWIGQDADRAYIPTGAEGALAGAADQHRIDSRIVLPVGQDRIELLDHGEVDRVERLGPIEGEDRKSTRLNSSH